MKFISFFSFLLMPMALFAQKRTEMTIYFDFDKAVIRPTDKRLLDSLAATFPPEAKNISIEIYGHCDMRGSEGYNDTLSLKRAKVVEKYLLSRAVKLSWISDIKGYGQLHPVVDPRTIYQNQFNRRVELTITIPEETIPPVEQSGENSISKILDDTATKAGTTIILENMNFIGGTHYLLSSSFKTLQDLWRALKKNKNLEIQIEGHVCCLPDASDGYDADTHTNNLSEERAKAIYTYLVNGGIDPARLAYKGYGHSKPIYKFPERSEQERIMNRRVEIKIRKK